MAWGRNDAWRSTLSDVTQNELETDYLVVGAGAGGMAFTDALLAHSDATVAIVDRRHAPGGHWVDAYPFVRLHQPAAFYGVASVPLGVDEVESHGTNAGFYDLSSADELRAYFARVMTRHFLPTGRVRFFPSSSYVGEGDAHRFVSQLGGGVTEVRVKRKVVDTTYLEGEIPATSPPPFEVDEGVRCIPAGDVVRLKAAPERFVIVGAGKTALDTCVWLLEHGVAPSRIRWIRPRESWWLNRKFQQPHALLPDLYRGAALQLAAIAEATSAPDLFARLEREELVFRIDPRSEPTMFHGALVSDAELALLRRVEDVVRMGRVRKIRRDAIVLDGGEVPTHERTVHIHCASRGLARPPLRPIFEEGRVTLQPFLWSFACFQFASLGAVEAMIASDEEKNRLCPPIAYWDTERDYMLAFAASMHHERARLAYPTLAQWAKSTRLNPIGNLALHKDDARVVEARDCIKRVAGNAVSNLSKLLG